MEQSVDTVLSKTAKEPFSDYLRLHCFLITQIAMLKPLKEIIKSIKNREATNKQSIKSKVSTEMKNMVL